ncbi:unnamed protein product [Paramecium sonneborni]|uniref:hydroxymethylbilane synthase n=1 Tax=Paramecium sonneborni TaxID=65129 RepID=A0A8S1N952_9CILI|nr:unnamed protein product [Paramecium sonneborni]
MLRQLSFATRSSALAMVQTNYIINEFKQECHIIKVSNEIGDMNLQYYKMPTVGLFTKQVEQYLLEQKANVAVHSFEMYCIQLHIQNLNKEEMQYQRIRNIITKVQVSQLPDWFNEDTSSLKRIATIRQRYPKQIQQIIEEQEFRNLMKDNMMQQFQPRQESQNQVQLIDLIQKKKNSYLHQHKQLQNSLQKGTIERLRVLNDVDAQKRCIAERIFLNQLEEDAVYKLRQRRWDSIHQMKSFSC